MAIEDYGEMGEILFLPNPKLTQGCFVDRTGPRHWQRMMWYCTTAFLITASDGRTVHAPGGKRHANLKSCSAIKELG